MKTPPEGPTNDPRGRYGAVRREIRTCSLCGAKFSAIRDSECCPVCILTAAGAESISMEESEAPTSEKERPLPLPRRFENYELMLDAGGQPIELGRGAMGVTYKAFDVNLRRPVTLKLIRDRYLGNESARLRFLREARAAASLRHPNVAAVFHLGRSGHDYFYAMEFVEGETLERRIKRCGRLEAKLALDIAGQVASGLAAIHKMNLVHRDIKPTNIMVSLEDEGPLTARIIDLGLAKAIEELPPDAGISTPGAFAGTPHFASPEQCAGRPADIRSDLYALGISLWQMLTGTLPFDGSAVEVMSQHLYSRLPVEQLENVPPVVVVLIKSLLDKDPDRRPQSPVELRSLLNETRETLETKGKVRPSYLLRPAAEPRRRSAVPVAAAEDRSVAAKGLAYRRPRGRMRRSVLQPWDFTPFLVEKRKDFTGRAWVFREINEWCAKGFPPVLLIVGEPGVGKSAIFAELVHLNPDDQVLAYHCCRADTPVTLEPAGFVRSVAAMLSSRLEEYAAILEGPAIVELLTSSNTDPASAFDGAVLAPLHKIKPPDGPRHYLLIDALDETMVQTQRPTIVDLLCTRFDRLPSWLGIVATMRADPSLLNRLRSVDFRILSAQDHRNRGDVRSFIRDRLTQPVLREKARVGGRIFADLEDGLLTSSAGNFLFVTTALNAVENGQLTFDQIEKLPPGLSSLYEIFFHRLFRDAGVDFAPSRSILETIAASRESLTRGQIATACGLEAEEELPPILSRLASFVPASEGRYAFYHKSLADWLTSWDSLHDQPLAGPYHINQQKGGIRLANCCWGEYQAGGPHLSIYTLRHLPAHLHQVGRNRDLCAVLSDFSFLQRKLEVTDATALIADCEYLPAAADLRLVQSVIRLSTHVLVRDQRQLGAQLTGRLLGNPGPDIKVLLESIAANQPGPWLRPLTPSLAPPGGPLVRTFEGHTSWVHAVVLTPDGHRAISASWDGTLRVWDIESGHSLRTLSGHTSWVNAVALTPDGWVLSGSSDCTLLAWDLESGELVRTLRGHTDRVNAVAVTPDGDRVVSASYDQTLRVWDLENGLLIRKLEGHLGWVNAVTITPDGRYAVSGSADHTLGVWDLESGQLVRTLQGHTDWVNSVVVTPDGRRAISASADNTLRVWDLSSGRTIRTLEGHTNRVTSVVLMSDGTRAISGSADQTLRMWDVERGQLSRILAGHTDWVTAVVSTRDGRRAISSSADRTLRMWDLERGQSVDKLTGHEESVTAVALLPEGRRAAFVSDYQVLKIWNLESGELIRTLAGHTDWVTAVAVTPDGRSAVTASADHTLRAWDLESGQTMRLLEGHTELVSAVAVAPDGQHAVSTSADQTLRMWNLESGASIRKIENLPKLISAVALTSDGRYVFCGSNVGTLLVWDFLKSSETVFVLEGHTDWVTAVAIAPDGFRAASASADGTMRLWNLQSGKLVRTLEERVAVVNAISVTPDGQHAISASSDHTIRVWDLESGICLAAFTGESPMLRCAIAPDGRTIIAREKSGRGHFLRYEDLS